MHDVTMSQVLTPRSRHDSLSVSSSSFFFLMTVGLSEVFVQAGAHWVSCISDDRTMGLFSREDSTTSCWESIRKSS